MHGTPDAALKATATTGCCNCIVLPDKEQEGRRKVLIFEE
jgi:hypothetical protein